MHGINIEGNQKVGSHDLFKIILKLHKIASIPHCKVLCCVVVLMVCFMENYSGLAGSTWLESLPVHWTEKLLMNLCYKLNKIIIEPFLTETVVEVLFCVFCLSNYFKEHTLLSNYVLNNLKSFHAQGLEGLQRLLVERLHVTVPRSLF